MKLLFALTAVFLLSACGANMELAGGYLFKADNPQSKAGFQETLLRWSTITNADGTQENQLNYLYLLNGQESGSLTVEMVLSDGTIYKFKGTDITAFAAFETRGGVETAIAKVLGELATPEMVAGLASLFISGVPAPIPVPAPPGVP